MVKPYLMAEDTRIVGKVRPWDEVDEEYVLYGDGDYILIELTPEEVKLWDIHNENTVGDAGCRTTGHEVEEAKEEAEAAQGLG